MRLFYFFFGEDGEHSVLRKPLILNGFFIAVDSPIALRDVIE